MDNKEIKISECNRLCSVYITNGVTYNDEHFSYSSVDQNNILNLVQMALATGMDIPYHADGQSCKMYSSEDIIGIYIALESNLTAQTTYCNQLKQYINSLTDEEAKSVEYGQELTGKYLDTYNMIMANSEKIIKKFIGLDE